MQIKPLLRSFVLTAGVMVQTAPTTHAQAIPDPVREINDLINDAFGQVATVNARISNAADEISRNQSAGARPTPGRTELSGAELSLRREISEHPLSLNATGACKDEFDALLSPRSISNMENLQNCVARLSPRVRHQAPFDCANLFWVVRNDNQLQLVGHVEAEEDLARLSKSVGAQTISQVEVLPYPGCAAIKALEVPISSELRPELRMLIGKERIAFGESLAFEVTTPDFFSFLYVAYMQADGSVYNLTPRRAVIRPQVDPNTTVVFGDGGPGRQTFTAAEPPGTEAVIAIAARSPIEELESIDSGNTGPYEVAGRPLDRARFLELLEESMNDEYAPGGARREISADILHLTVVP
jgi:hypothetical protein